MKSAVLAYSGGLDTSVTIRWLVEQGYEVFPVAVDVGQKEDFDKIVERGRLAGAAEVRVVDAVDRFAAEYLDQGDQGQRPVRGQVPDGQRPGSPLHRGGGREASPERWTQRPSPTAVPARATTRCVSRSRSAFSPPTLQVLAPIRDANIPREKAIALASEWGIPIADDRHQVHRR